jgi:hypothetical protein
MHQLTTKQLRKMGASLHLTIPATFVRQFNLSQGDTVFFDPDGDGLKLKFLKLSVMSDMAGVQARGADPDAGYPPRHPGIIGHIQRGH